MNTEPNSQASQPGEIGAAASGKMRGRLWLFAGLGAVALLVVLLLAWSREQGFQWQRFASTFQNLDPWWLAAAAAFALSTYFGRALRWRLLIRPQKRDSKLWSLFTATAIGFTAIVLFGRPGEMVRPYLISRNERLSFSSQMAAWLLERIYDLLMALLIFGFALSRVRASGVQTGESLGWVLEVGGYFVVGIGLICVVVLIAFRQFGETSRQRILEAIRPLPDRYRLWVSNMVTAFAQGVESTKDTVAILGVLSYSVLEWFLIVGCNYCIFRASKDTSHFMWTDILIFVGFVAFGAVVQIPGIGGGFQLVAIVVLTELFGMPLEVSSGLAFLIWMITFVVIVPFGLLLAFREGLHWRNLRRLSKEHAQ